MDISNGTPLDVPYKVSGGGTPVGGHHGRPIPSEETSSWAVIAANSVVRVPVTSKGPWRVHFAVNGEEFIAESTSDNDQVQLIPAEKGFRTMIRKVSHSTGKVVIPPGLSKSS